MIKTIKEWKLYKESILVPRNLEGRDEKIRQRLYRMFTGKEVINGDIDIIFDLDIDPSKVKTKKINGHVQLRNITKIPQFFKDIEINGSFNCSQNNLISLEGCPQIVHDHFWCHSNKLTSLEGCPKGVEGNFTCSQNKLTSLKGCPKEVGLNFWCQYNAKQFTQEEVKKYCKVGGDIYV